MSQYVGTGNLEVMADAINYNNFLVELVLKHAKAGDRILDFGAGIGTFSRRISERGHDVTCVEPDPDQAAVIAESGLSVHNSLDQIADESLDYLYMLNVLEHVEHDVALLREIHRKLKPGGRLLIYVPAFNVLFSSMDREVGHYRRYTRSSLASAARLAGFSINRTRYCDSLGFFATLVYKLLGDNSGRLNPRSLIAYDRIAFPLSRFADLLAGPIIGKNVVLVGEKKAAGALI